jgi:hypothetical protein
MNMKQVSPASDVAQAADQSPTEVERIRALRPSMADVVAALAEAKEGVSAQQKPAPMQAVSLNTRSMAQSAEMALLKVIAAASTVCDNICDIGAAVPSDEGVKGARPVLLASSDGVAKLIKSVSDAVHTAIDDMLNIPVLRVNDAAAVPGEGTRADEDYPLRSEMEAYDQARRKYGEQKS